MAMQMLGRQHVRYFNYSGRQKSGSQPFPQDFAGVKSKKPMNCPSRKPYAGLPPDHGVDRI